MDYRKSKNKYLLLFPPTHLAIIIPPIVQIIPRKPGILDVYLQSPPVILNDNRYSLKDFYGSMVYKIKIWMNASEEVIFDDMWKWASLMLKYTFLYTVNREKLLIF